jgi:cell division protein FtsB
MEEQENVLGEKSKVQLDIKALIGMVLGIVSIAGVWFSLTAEISQLQLDVIRMQDDVELNHEFRVKWPRGEMGALPDDAKQDLRIEYLQKEVDELRKTVKELEIENAKMGK